MTQTAAKSAVLLLGSTAPCVYAVVMDGHTHADMPGVFVLPQRYTRLQAIALAEAANSDNDRMGRSERWHVQYVGYVCHTAH